MNNYIKQDMKYIMDNLKNNTTIEFIYSPKNIRQHRKSDYMWHPVHKAWFNKFYLTKYNGRLQFIDEDGNVINTRTPRKGALELFYEYFYDPQFSTMVVLRDDIYGENIIFYDSDKEQFYKNIV